MQIKDSYKERVSEEAGLYTNVGRCDMNLIINGYARNSMLDSDGGPRGQAVSAVSGVTSLLNIWQFTAENVFENV